MVILVNPLGMPPSLAHHFGHLFVRDPLVILQEHLHPTDESSSYHFEVSIRNELIETERDALEFELDDLVFASLETPSSG